MSLSFQVLRRAQLPDLLQTMSSLWLSSQFLFFVLQPRPQLHEWVRDFWSAGNPGRVDLPATAAVPPERYIAMHVRWGDKCFRIKKDAEGQIKRVGGREAKCVPFSRCVVLLIVLCVSENFFSACDLLRPKRGTRLTPNKLFLSFISTRYLRQNKVQAVYAEQKRFLSFFFFTRDLRQKKKVPAAYAKKKVRDLLFFPALDPRFSHSRYMAAAQLIRRDYGVSTILLSTESPEAVRTVLAGQYPGWTFHFSNTTRTTLSLPLALRRGQFGDGQEARNSITNFMLAIQVCPVERPTTVGGAPFPPPPPAWIPSSRPK